MRSLECYFGIYSPRCCATREINTKITFSWAHKQFATRVHRLFYINSSGSLGFLSLRLLRYHTFLDSLDIIIIITITIINIIVIIIIINRQSNNTHEQYVTKQTWCNKWNVNMDNCLCSILYLLSITVDYTAYVRYWYIYIGFGFGPHIESAVHISSDRKKVADVMDDHNWWGPSTRRWVLLRFLALWKLSIFFSVTS